MHQGTKAEACPAEQQTQECHTQKPNTHGEGDKVMILQDPNCKHGEPLFKGPHMVTKVNDNGAVQLTKAADNGRAVTQTQNIQNLEPIAALSPAT